MRTTLAAVLLLAAAPAAEAHAFLDTAVPAVGSTVAAAPASVTIHFTEQVEPAFSTIAVTDTAGHRVDAGAPQIVAGDASRLAVKLRPLGRGEYRVVWHATSVDTHRTHGRFTFMVGARMSSAG